MFKKLNPAGKLLLGIKETDKKIIKGTELKDSILIEETLKTKKVKNPKITLKLKEASVVKKARGRPRVKPLKVKQPRVGRPNDPNKVKLKIRQALPKLDNDQAKKLFDYLETLLV